MTVASWFLVAPEPGPEPGGRAARAVPAAPTAGRIAILLHACPDQGGLGGVLALALARHARTPGVLVLGWRATDGRRPALPATPGCRRLARALQARDLCARATGRIVHADLPDDDAEAAEAATRAVAAAPAAWPVVIVLGGARGDALDALLPGADVVVVAGRPEDPRAEAARSGVERAGSPVVLWSALPGGPRRRLAGCGIAGGTRAGLPAEALR